MTPTSVRFLSKIVITDLGRGRFNVDYYRDTHNLATSGQQTGRINVVAVDLGVNPSHIKKVF